MKNQHGLEVYWIPTGIKINTHVAYTYWLLYTLKRLRTKGFAKRFCKKERWKVESRKLAYKKTDLDLLDRST